MEKRNVLISVGFSVLAIFIISFAFFSSLNNKFLGYVGIFLLPIAWLIIAFTFIKSGKLWLRALLTSILAPLVSVVIFFINGIKVGQGGDFAFGFFLIIIGGFIFRAALVFFIFYSSLVAFITTRKIILKAMFLFFIIIFGLIFLWFFIYTINYEIETYSLDSCDDRKFDSDYINCIKSKCNLAPRNAKKCIFEKSKKENNLHICAAFSSLYTTEYENPTGWLNFKECMRDFFKEKNAPLEFCFSFTDSSNREYDPDEEYAITCYEAYKKEYLGKITCNDLKLLHSNIGIYGSLEYEKALKDTQLYCGKDNQYYQEHCTYIKNEFEGEFCQPTYFYYDYFKEECQKFQQLYDEYCQGIPLDQTETLD